MPVLDIAIAGLVGTVLMSLTMGLITVTHITNADMIRGVGSLVTKRLDNAFPVGLLLHLIAGALFAVPYTYVLRSMPVISPGTQIAGGGALGAFHGVAMAFILMALVAEKHPIERFRKAGVEVAAAHIVGHVAYGMGVGLMSALLFQG